jgi:hypothetical protein
MGTMLLLVAAALIPDSAVAMPSYARQTGLDCNSCHIGFSPVPLFTRTGRLFIMRGFHQPNSIQGKFRETGYNAQGKETPQYGGNYLALNWQDFFAARLITSVVSGGASNDGTKRPTTSNAGSRMALYFTGPVTDWLGVWTEIGYLGNQSLKSVSPGTAGNATNKNYFAYDEYRLTGSWMTGPDSFIGMAVGNEAPDAINEFVFPLYQLRPWGYGQGGVGNEFSTTAFSVYGFWNNRWLTQYTIQTGDTDNSWSDGHNNYVAIGYDGLPGTGDMFRKESNDMWLVGEVMWGNNQGSQVNPLRSSLLCPATCPAGVTDTNLSITNSLGYQGETIADLRQFNGTGIETVDDFTAWRLSVHSSVADWGNNSWYQSVALISNHQKYKSHAKSERSSIGYTIRYFYNRTYGFDFRVNNDLNYNYYDPAGVKHEANTHLNWGVGFMWVPAMNMNLRASYNPSHTTVLDPANYQDSGYSWSLSLDYAF